MLCVLVAGCSDDQTATVIPQPETKQTQNNKNQEITVTVYRAPVNGEEYLLPEKVIPQSRRDDCSGDCVDILVTAVRRILRKWSVCFLKGQKSEQ